MPRASAPDRAHNALDALGGVLAAVGALARRQPTDEVLGMASVTATMVDVLPESRNVIPDKVVVTLDWRILPRFPEEKLQASVREALAEQMPALPPGLSVSVRMATEQQRTYTGLQEDRNLMTPGFLMESDHPVVLAAAAAVGRRGDSSVPATVRPWAFATDGGWSSGVFGIPTIGFAPGEERFAHTNRERLDVEEARWAFDRYPALITAVQQVLAG